ncbi:hypothetical protein PAXRUDRAFT_13410 [Paxillus rubicundulus Ve08.2h10]|uniref:Unplaced genomic scaffold scaffold_489, whole genome shotgun sequence n=1 Tax=Paxillus rubicundulus Ve08.2h10 TaxID=930991 RepID=A0A0D0DTT5_9AGAM|nr:hypothetical protein PAXRUDRAFT_13410 [Paxillus rubicundulus Ve08.2h10]
MPAPFSVKARRMPQCFYVFETCTPVCCDRNKQLAPVQADRTKAITGLSLLSRPSLAEELEPMDEVELRYECDGNPFHEVLQHFERQCILGTDRGALLRHLRPVYQFSCCPRESSRDFGFHHHASVDHGIGELVETPQGGAERLNVC